jgi:signal transduction histidine kinase/ActR/RegA family two-component response regulator
MLVGSVELREEWVSSALKATGGGVWMLDVATQQFTWTSGLAEIFQLTEFGGRVDDWLALLHPDDREAAASVIQHAIAVGTSYVMEYRVNGVSPPRWLRVHGEPVFGADGAARSIVGSVLDVSESRHALDVMVQLANHDWTSGEQFYARAVEALRETLGADLAFVAEIAGGGAAHILGGSLDGQQLTGASWQVDGTPLALIDPERVRLQLVPRGLGAQFPHDRSVAEFQMEAFAGVSVVPEGHGRKGILAVMWRRPMCRAPTIDAVLRMVAAQVGAEMLRASTALERERRDVRLARQRAALAEISTRALPNDLDRFSALEKLAQLGADTLELDGVRVVLFEAAPASLPRGAFRFVARDALEPLQGFRQSFAEARVLVAQAESAVMRELLDALQVGSGVRDALLVPVRVEGQLRGALCCSPVGAPRTWYEDELSFAGSLGDVASATILAGEHRELEARLRHAERLESVGRLAGGLAHDFNNLLTAIDASAELALTLARSRELVEVELLEEITAGTQRASRMTRQLLTFARRHPLRVENVDINQLVVASERMLRRLIPEHVELRSTLCLGELIVTADPAQFEQVLVNLVLNARDAIQGRGLIHVATQERVVAGERRASLTVSDNGSGMDPEVMKQVFDPFFTTKPTGRGTGLGLATSYGIVRQARGEIKVSSTLGAGTQFEVLLPLASGQCGLPASVPEAEPAAEGHEVVLLVEDDGAVRRGLSRGLRRLGYEVLEAQDGFEAMTLAREHGRRIEAVVSDVVMPMQSGLELVAELKPLLGDVPALFVTGYTADQQLAQRIERLGAELLQKPFTPQALGSRLRQLVQARHPLHTSWPVGPQASTKSA